MQGEIETPLWPDCDNDGEDAVIISEGFLQERCREDPELYPYLISITKRLRWMVYSSKVWANNTKYFGIELFKFPTDLWVIQELMFKVKPSIFIETGTWKGGSALFFAHTMDRIGNGRVITIDNVVKENLPEHPRITYIVGDCLSDEIVDEVKTHLNGGPVMVNLDSCHQAFHVYKEMNLYCPFITEGSYLIVEDGILGHPVMVDDRAGKVILPGPYEAINAFLKQHKEFEADRMCEKFFLTQNPKGFLKRCETT